MDAAAAGDDSMMLLIINMIQMIMKMIQWC